MADAFDTAQQEIENQRRAALAAIAANGSAGAQALADSNSQIGSLRKAALDAALANAARTGAPLAAQKELSGIIGRPYDLLSASTNQMAASNAARQAALAQAVPTYFSQMAAAVPVARTALKSRIDTLNAEAAAKAKEQQDQLSDSELRTRLLGAGEGLKQQALGVHRNERDLGREQRDSLRQRRDALRHELAVRVAEGRLQPGRGRQRTLDIQKLLQVTKGQIQATKKGIREDKVNIGNLKASGTERYAQRAGIASGLDPDLVRGLIQIPEAKQEEAKGPDISPTLRRAAVRAGLTPEDAAKITRTSPPNKPLSWFERSATEAQAAISRGDSLASFKQALNKHVPKKLRRTKALILSIYGPQFGG